MIRLILACFIISSFYSVPCFGQEQSEPPENESVAEPYPEEQEEAPELSREEMIERVVNILEGHLDIRSSIEGITMLADEEASFFYYKNTRIDKLDDETILMLMRQVNQKMSWKNYQRTEQMLKNMRQINQFNRQQRQLRQIRQQQQFNRQQKQLRQQR
jgi:tRNA U34 5-carboxymethylaminomethyl modifying GTPase MnmE/TrmE